MNGMKKRTPIEQAIAESSDRRAKYEAKMRADGFAKTSLWVPIDCLSDIRLLCKLLGATNGQYRRGLSLLVAAKFSSGGEDE